MNTPGGTWGVARGPRSVGSAHLEKRLQESLRFLTERFSVSVPKAGRHQAALDVLGRWNTSDDPIDLTDHAELHRISEAHRLAWETFFITVAALEDLRNSVSPFTPEALQIMMGRDLTEEGRDGLPRNIQFELFVAATLRLPGASVMAGEPDFRMVYGQDVVGVAVKRIRSLNDDQVQKHARSAARQIAHQEIRGWIALNLDSRFAVIDNSQPEATLFEEFDRTFNSLTSALRRATLKPHVLGFMLFGHVHSWHPPAGGATEPRLHSAPLMRWQGLVDEPADAELFEAFTNQWSERYGVRLQTIGSKDFVGEL